MQHVSGKSSQNLCPDHVKTAAMQWNLPLSRKQTLPAFQIRQHRRSLGITEFVASFIGFVTHSKSFVVDESATAKCLIDQIFLFPIWVDSKFNTFLH